MFLDLGESNPAVYVGTPKSAESTLEKMWEESKRMPEESKRTLNERRQALLLQKFFDAALGEPHR
jgi:hypothetical protein